MYTTTTNSDCVAVGRDALFSLDGSDTNAADGSVAVGYFALRLLTSGIGNVAVGAYALDANATSDYNTAVGHQALSAVNGDSTGGNTAVGRLAGASITSGISNTAVGHVALYQDDDGTGSVAVGSHALFTQNIANAVSGNTGVGTEAGYFNETGQNNTYVGSKAGQGASGDSNSNNTGVGKHALYVVEDGNDNVCVGRDSLSALTDANDNVAVGSLAGSTITDGNGNTCVGYNSDTSASDSTNQIVLGADVSGSGDGTLTFGNSTSDTTCTNGATTWSNPSDVRIKKDIETSTVGLSMINDLRPVNFKFKTKGEVDSDFYLYEKDSNESAGFTDKTVLGFVAQEVKSVIDNHAEYKGSELWLEGLELHDKRQRISQTALIPILTKAIQELSAKVKELEDAQ
jgi:hypothetical protein